MISDILGQIGLSGSVQAAVELALIFLAGKEGYDMIDAKLSGDK